MREIILRTLMHKPGLSFNALWNKQDTSNKFAYHLKTLEKGGLIKKDQGAYFLTSKGKSESAFIDGESGKKSKAPLIGVIAVVVNDDGKILLHKRQKEPFYGYWAMPAGKMKFEHTILESAKDEILEETGLTCDLELKGIFSAKTFQQNSLTYNHQMFIVKATNPKGNLIPSTREGNNEWFTFDEIKQLETIPNVVGHIEACMADSFRWTQVERQQENDQFTSSNTIHDIEY